MIEPSDVSNDEDLARSILMDARSVAPCIDAFESGTEEYANTLAVLRRAAKEAEERGSRLIESHTAGRTNVKYATGSDLSEKDLTRLRSLCGAASAGAGPVGSFPEDRPLSRIWPELYT